MNQRYNLRVSRNTVTLTDTATGRSESYSTSGPSDPRITQARILCRAAGFDIQVLD